MTAERTIIVVSAAAERGRYFVRHSNQATPRRGLVAFFGACNLCLVMAAASERRWPRIHLEYGHSVAVIDHSPDSFRRLPEGFSGQRVRPRGADPSRRIEDAHGLRGRLLGR